MTDLTKLKDLAERASALHGTPSLEHSAAITEFRNTANPQAILGLIAEIEEHDGILNVWRGRTQRAEAEAERLKTENEALRKAFDEANEMLARIGDFAHDKSTGPAMPDALWEVRSMAYSAVRIDFDAALEGGGR